MYKSAASFLHLYLKRVGVKIKHKSVTDESRMYYHFPDYLSIVKILHTWNLSSEVYEINQAELSKIDRPFISLLDDRFVTAEITKEMMVLVQDGYSGYALTIPDFFSRISRFIILSNKPKTTEVEHNDSSFHLGKRYYGLGLAAILIVSFLSLHGNMPFRPIDPALGILGVSKLIGLGISIILSKYALNKNDATARRFCAKDACEVVLSSLSGWLPFRLTWPDLGCFYFSGTMFLIMTKPVSSSMILELAFLNMACLIFSVFSVYFQIRVIKTICKLCLITQLIFWIEFALFQFMPLRIPSTFSIYQMCDDILRLALPGVMWMLVKPVSLIIRDLRKVESQLLRVKYNPGNFLNMLNAEKCIELPPLSDCIYFGDEKARIQIAMVTDPLCKPCSEAIQKLFNLTKFRNDIRIVLIFLPFSNEIKTSYVRHIYSLFKTDPQLARNAMLEWYNMSKKNYVTWSAKYPIDSLKDISALKTTHDHFCTQSSTEVAPTIFVNGRKLPLGYFAEDLKYLI